MDWVLFHSIAESSICVLEFSVEHSYQGGKSFMRYFKDEVPQTGHGEGFNKVVLFEDLLIQVVRFKYLSIGIISIIGCFFFLIWEGLGVVGGWGLVCAGSFGCRYGDDEDMKSKLL